MFSFLIFSDFHFWSRSLSMVSRSILWLLITARTNIEMAIYSSGSFTALHSAWGRDPVSLTVVCLAPAIGSAGDTICWTNENFRICFYYIFLWYLLWLMSHYFPLGCLTSSLPPSQYLLPCFPLPFFFSSFSKHLLSSYYMPVSALVTSSYHFFTWSALDFSSCYFFCFYQEYGYISRSF